MNQDLRISKNDGGLFDLVLSNQSFETVDGFETAIIISLLTDARASAAAVQTPSRRRGWIGNILTADNGRQLGSRLWTFEQARLTVAVLNDLSVAAQESLAWMVEDGIAKSVNASAEKINDRQVNVLVVIVTIEGKEKRYSVLWRQTGAI